MPKTLTSTTLEKLSKYSFQIGYKKGTELVLADFLSLAPSGDHDEIDRVVPIACCLYDESNLLDMNTLHPAQQTDRIVTRAYAKKMGIPIPDIYPKKPNTHDNKYK